MTRPELTPNDLKNKKIISDNLKTLMEKHNYTQAEAAKLSGVAKSTLGDYIRGEVLPSRKNVEKLSSLFNVKKEDIDPRYSGRDGKEENSADTKDLQKFLEVNRKGMSFGDDPITDEQKEKLDIALKMIFEKYKDKR